MRHNGRDVVSSQNPLHCVCHIHYAFFTDAHSYVEKVTQGTCDKALMYATECGAPRMMNIFFNRSTTKETIVLAFFNCCLTGNANAVVKCKNAMRPFFKLTAILKLMLSGVELALDNNEFDCVRAIGLEASLSRPNFFRRILKKICEKGNVQALKWLMYETDALDQWNEDPICNGIMIAAKYANWSVLLHFLGIIDDCPPLISQRMDIYFWILLKICESDDSQLFTTVLARIHAQTSFFEALVDKFKMGSQTDTIALKITKPKLVVLRTLYHLPFANPKVAATTLTSVQYAAKFRPTSYTQLKETIWKRVKEHVAHNTINTTKIPCCPVHLDTFAHIDNYTTTRLKRPPPAPRSDRPQPPAAKRQKFEDIKPGPQEDGFIIGSDSESHSEDVSSTSEEDSSDCDSEDSEDRRFVK
jgi:hypothetical protein